MCRWSWDICGMAGTVLAPIWPGYGDALGAPQGGGDAGVGDVLAVVEAFRVDAEQYFDTVPGPLGHAGRGDASRQPERYRRVAQVIGATGQGRGDLGGS